MVELDAYFIPEECANVPERPAQVTPMRLYCLIGDCEDPDYRQTACWRFRRPLYPGGTASC